MGKGDVAISSFKMNVGNNDEIAAPSSHSGSQ